jgi:patatin-related protein
MREKELRLALICYGGISLAIYMHGVTREVWHLVRASRAFHEGSKDLSRSETVYARLLELIEVQSGVKLRVLNDIIAGASAGGINGIFLAQAISSGQSLAPLTDLWLENADVDRLLDPDARPISAFTKFWATPIAWWVSGRRGGTVERTVDAGSRDEVRSKLKRFVRARWFEPPFGGEIFTTMLLDAFDSMSQTPSTGRLLPEGQPLDLFVTVTDFAGHPQTLRLNSPAQVIETEHRLTVSFNDSGQGQAYLGDPASLAFAARATASFPGAFPPVTAGEMDRALVSRNATWPDRNAFLHSLFPNHAEGGEQTVLIDGSVLANAPFRPAIDALRDRPARREIDRRFVYIDPKPGTKSVRLTSKGKTELPGFFTTIFGAMSDIPREQPIRDSLEAIEARSARIRRMQRVIEALRPNVEAAIEALFGRTFFLDRPTPARMTSWRRKAQERAALDAGYAFPAYAHAKLSSIVEDLAALVARQRPELRSTSFDEFRKGLWNEIRAQDIDRVTDGVGKGASKETITFFQAQDLGFRVRRLRSVLRTLSTMQGEGRISGQDADPIRTTIFQQLAPFLDRERTAFYRDFDPANPEQLLVEIAEQRDLVHLDLECDAAFAQAIADCPKTERRPILFSYLGFPFYDVSTLPMLQGEGLDEFDPIKVDRISPDDATAIRGGVAATLKGIQFNSFGAFFSRSYRENDYLWGRLHGADRLFDIVLSTTEIMPATMAMLKRDLLLAILDEEEPRLHEATGLIASLRDEIAANADAS